MLAWLGLSASAAAQPVSGASLGFERHFADSTLRLDYTFGGDTSSTSIMVNGISKFKGWAGRRHNLSRLPLQGNGQLVLLDPERRHALCHFVLHPLSGMACHRRGIQPARSV